jgi:hypothetical protein
MRYSIIILLLFVLPAFATNYTVKAGGGGSFTSITNCMTQMSTNGPSVSDTCTVFAGTYNETPTVPAGNSGIYKIVNVNSTDVVSVLGFTLNSHTKLIGNCPIKQGTVTTATCGFFISHTAAPTTAACIALPSSTTDVYIINNVLYACGQGPGTAMIQGSGASYVYVQGNTWNYSGVTVAQAGTAVKEGNGAEFDSSSNHILYENNDASHYTLNFCCGDQTFFIIRNNSCHDQFETEAGGNAHTDCFYWSPNVTTAEIVVEGNFQYNGVGANAKGILNQGEFSPCSGACGGVLIYRFNTVKSIGSGNTSSYGWNHFVMYNNTYYDIGNLCANGCFGGGDNFFTDTFSMKNWADLKSIWYFPGAQTSGGIANPVAADSGSVVSPFNTGYNLAYCNASGATNCALFGHVYEAGTWTGDTGNIIGYIGHSPTNDPLFVSNGTNFNLQSSSPAIGAGTYLTTANGSGSGSTALVVNDASYFQDSYGLSNAYSTVYPDCISITTVTNHVCISSVNYSTNTITLASAISWSNGDHIWLYSKSDNARVLYGTAPDMGAFPNATISGGSGAAINGVAIKGIVVQ